MSFNAVFAMIFKKDSKNSAIFKQLGGGKIALTIL